MDALLILAATRSLCGTSPTQSNGHALKSCWNGDYLLVLLLALVWIPHLELPAEASFEEILGQEL